jgi:hypothetical protein
MNDNRDPKPSQSCKKMIVGNNYLKTKQTNPQESQAQSFLSFAQASRQASLVADIQ